MAHPLLDSIFRWRLSYRHHIDSAALAVKHYLAIDQREKRVIIPLANAFARMEFIAKLANEDVAGDHFFAAKFLHATSLGIAVATIAARALSFFMSHCTKRGQGSGSLVISLVMGPGQQHWR